MPSLSAKGAVLAICCMALGGALGGCTTSAGVTYGEYQYGPGYETGRIYENTIYGDTGRGVGSKACRVVIRRQADAYGRIAEREITVCNE